MKKKYLILLTISFLLIAKLFIGIFKDDEFPEYFPFLKHRPIWKSYFFSPRGMRDWKLEDMPLDLQKEQKLYDEFILGER